jgi:hypothetical protein
MVRGSKEDLPLAEDYGEGFRSHQVEWGGMIVEISSFPAGVDATPLFKGLPDNMCQSQHWGYVLQGRLRMRYKNHAEVFAAGDVYHIEPGHVPLSRRIPRSWSSVPRGTTRERWRLWPAIWRLWRKASKGMPPRAGACLRRSSPGS